MSARDLATYALCGWAITVGLYYLDLDIPLKPFVLVAFALSLGALGLSLHRREPIAAGMSLLSLVPIALLVAAGLIIALGGAWDR